MLVAVVEDVFDKRLNSSLGASDDPNGTSLAPETCQEPGARAKLEQTSDSS